MKMRKKIFVLALLFYFLSKSVCIAEEPVSKIPQKLTTINYLFDWKMPSLSSGYFVALEKGFYKEEGLDVSFENTNSSMSNIKMLMEKKATLVSAQAVSVIKFRSQDLPIVSVAALFQSTGNTILSLKESNIKVPNDLIGKKIGILFGTNLDETYKTLLFKTGIDRKKINEENIDNGALLLMDKKIDACTSGTYGTWPIQLELSGKNISVIDVRDYGIDWYGTCIVAHEDLIKQNPDLIKSFVKATIKGWDYVISHPEEAADIIVKYKPETNRNFLIKSIEKISPLILNKDSGQNTIGIQSEEKWKQMQEDLFAIGSINNRIDPKFFFTNDFMPKNE